LKKVGLAAVIIIILIVAGGWFFMRNMGGMGGNMPGNGGGGMMGGSGGQGGMMGGSDSVEDMKNDSFAAGEKPLPIPPILEDENPDPGKAEFSLVAQNGSMEFLEGKKTDTFGYNGDYLGPVIRVHNGDDVSIKVKNELDEATTVHWHGLEVDGGQDGGPHAGIPAGTIWKPKFQIPLK